MAMEISFDTEFTVPHTRLPEGKAASKLQIAALPNFTCHCWVKEKNAFFAGQANGSVMMWYKNRESQPEMDGGFVAPDLRLPGHAGGVTCMVWHPHFKLLITGSLDRYVKVFDPFTLKISDSTQRCVQSLAAHENAVTAISVFAQFLITAGNDRTIRIWKNEEGRELLMYPLFTCMQTFTDLPGWITGITAAPLPRGGDYPDIIAGDWEGNLILIKCADFDKFAGIEELLSEPVDQARKNILSQASSSQKSGGAIAAATNGDLMEMSSDPIAERRVRPAIASRSGSLFSGSTTDHRIPRAHGGARSAPPARAIANVLRYNAPSVTRGSDPMINESVSFEIVKRYKKYHQQAITKALYLWGENTVVTISFDNTARISDAVTLGSTTTIENPRGARYVSVDYNPEQEEIWLIDTKGFLDVYRFSSHRVVHTEQLVSFPTNASYVPQKGMFIVSHRHGNNFYNVFRSVPYREYRGHEAPVIGMDYVDALPGVAAEGALLVSVSQDNLVIVWNCYDFVITPIQRFHLHAAEVTAFAVVGSERLVVTGHDDGSMRMILIDAERILTMQAKGLGHQNTVSAMTVASHTIYRTEIEDEPHVFTGDYDGYVATWDLRHKKPLHPGLLNKWKAHESEVLAVIYSGLLRVHATAGNDTLIKIWKHRGVSHASPEPIAVLRGHSDAITALAFDGNILISASHDHTIRLWNGVTWEFLTVLTRQTETPSAGISSSEAIIEEEDDMFAHTAEVTALRMVPLAGVLVSSSRDGIVRLWDSARNKVIYTYERHAEFLSLACDKRATDIFAGTDSGIILRFSRKPEGDLDADKVPE